MVPVSALRTAAHRAEQARPAAPEIVFRAEWIPPVGPGASGRDRHRWQCPQPLAVLTQTLGTGRPVPSRVVLLAGERRVIPQIADPRGVGAAIAHVDARSAAALNAPQHAGQRTRMPHGMPELLPGELTGGDFTPEGRTEWGARRLASSAGAGQAVLQGCGGSVTRHPPVLGRQPRARLLCSSPRLRILPPLRRCGRCPCAEASCTEQVAHPTAGSRAEVVGLRRARDREPERWQRSSVVKSPVRQPPLPLLKVSPSVLPDACCRASACLSIGLCVRPVGHDTVTLAGST